MEMLNQNTPSTAGHSVSLRQLFSVYLQIGLIGFGPAIAVETKKQLIKKRNWISEEDFINGWALGELLPGATFVSLTVYIGYKLRSVAGALAAFLGLLLPPFAIMLLLSYIYFTYGSLPHVSIVFQGVTAIVAGVVANAVLIVGKSAVTEIKGVLIAAAAIALTLINPNIFLLLLLAAAAGIALFYPSVRRQVLGAISKVQPYPASDRASAISVKQLTALVILLAIIVFVSLCQPVLQQLGWTFFRMGAFVFGNGFTMIPLIQQEVVNNYQWLTLDDFMVGLALGQVTPGPVLITAAFVGYKAAAVSGAIAATVGMFLPSFVLVMITAEIHQKLRHNIWVKSGIKGIVAAFTGTLVVVAAELARHALVNIPAAIMAIATFGVLRFTKINTVWVVTGGAAAYWLASIFS